MKKEKFTSIKSKLISVLFVTCVLGLIISGIILTNNINEKFTDIKKEVIHETTHSINAEANLFIQKYIGIVKQMAHDKNLQDFLIEAKQGDTDLTKVKGFTVAADTLEKIQEDESDTILYAYIAEAEPSYYLVSSTVYAKEGDNYDITKKDYYKSISEGIVNITEPYVDVVSGDMVVTITAPVEVEGKVVGLAAVDIELTKLANLVLKYKLGETGHFALMSKDNTIISHKDSDNILKSVDEIGLGGDILDKINSNDGIVGEYTYKGDRVIGTIMSIGDTGWKIISAMPEEEFLSSTREVTKIITLVFILTILVLLIVMYILINKITKPIKDITNITNQLAEGKLDVNIDIKSNDEIGLLANSIEGLTIRLKSYIMYINESVELLNTIADGNLYVEFEHKYEGEFARLKEALIHVSDTLKETIGKIQESANYINENTEHVSMGAQTLAQGTTEQASAIEELSAEINEIYETILSNAKNAEDAGNKATETSKEVEKGNKHMQDMLSAMNEISKSSNEIGKIIKVIDDIAFQTNILALNAAVEAARAGEAGKGFAVVADEVRNLAGKSAEAAKQTTTLIENSINAINKGTLLADETGKSLTGIVNKAIDTNELISEIVNALAQQTVSVNQIKNGIEQISSIVQENAATAEADAAASEELGSQVQVMKDMTQKFKLD